MTVCDCVCVCVCVCVCAIIQHTFNGHCLQLYDTCPPFPPRPSPHSKHSHAHSLTHSLTHPPHPPTHSLTHPTHPPTHPLTHTLTHTHTHSLTHPLTHPPTHSLTHSLTHYLSCTYKYMCIYFVRKTTIFLSGYMTSYRSINEDMLSQTSRNSKTMNKSKINTVTHIPRTEPKQALTNKSLFW